MAELLTAEMVIRGSSILETCLIQASEVPVALPRAVVSSPLGPVIGRAVEKDLARRYGEASSMLEDLADAVRLMPSSLLDRPIAGSGVPASSRGDMARRTTPVTFPESLGGVQGPSLPSRPPGDASADPSPPVAAVTPTTGRGKQLVVLAIGASIFVVGLMASAAVVVAVVVSLRDEPTRPTAPVAPQGSTTDAVASGDRRGDPVIPLAGDGTKLGALTTDVVRERIQRAGWQVHYISDFGGQGRGQGVSFMIRKGRGSGTVTLLLFGSSSLTMGSRTIGGNTSVVIEGQRALEVEVAPNGEPTIGPDAASALVQAIVR
jgi:hypothetical protein